MTDAADAIMSTSRDSTEEHEREAMLTIGPKASNVSMMSVSSTKANTDALDESRDDCNGAATTAARPPVRDERESAPSAATTAATKKTTKASSKKTTKGRASHGRQPQYQQRGPIPYHTQVLGNSQQRGPSYGGAPPPSSYGFNPNGGPPHDPYGHDPRRHPQYPMHPMSQMAPHQQGFVGGPGGSFTHAGQHLPSFVNGPYGPPPPHMYPYQGRTMHQQRPPMSSFSEDTGSVGSSKSKSTKSGKSNSSSNSHKKRTIDGVDQRFNVSVPPSGLASAFSMHRTHSNASTSSTITAGNNTSTDTPNLTEDSPQKQRNHLPPLSSRPEYQGSANVFDDAHKQGYHRRDFSGASTTSSLSVGGLSLSSYETRGSKDDMPMMRNSPKRRRHDDRDTTSKEHIKKLSVSVKEEDKDHRENLFLSLSTSPINSDVEATPVSKNTKKPVAQKESAVTEIQTARSMESISKIIDRNSDTPTPPVPSGAADSDMITDEHLLNRHLRGQTFTPLPHIAHYMESRESNGFPGIEANPSFGSAIGAQLSWDITGDAPSLGEIADWEDHIRDNRPGSVASQASGAPFAQWKEGEMIPSSHYVLGGDAKNYESVLRLSVLSPHSDVDMEENAGAVGGGTTPIPFQDSHERENGQLKPSPSFSKDGNSAKPTPVSSGNIGQAKLGDAEHIHQLFVTNGGRGSDTSKTHSNQRPHMNWNGGAANYMRYPPAPLYTSDKSPMNGEMGFFPNANNLLSLQQHGANNDRIRNLRGRAPPGAQRLPMSHQLPPYYTHNLTSPMGAAPSKGTAWTPHAVQSPHRVIQPDPNSNSKRKCLPMKPPIPTKFQGDMDTYKNAHMPEFANLVNFPNAMTQAKQINPSSLPEGMRCCVMCGNACPCPMGSKHSKKNRTKPIDGSMTTQNGNGQPSAKDQQMAIIPSQNKGLCTLCDVNVWIVASTGLEIKWCKGCKNFRPWASFGDKGLATKCLRCRDRQREKYAIQKEEKERLRLVRKAAKAQAKAQGR